MELLLFLLIAVVVCYLAYTFLPQPINWIVCLVVIVALLFAFLGADGELRLHER